MNSPASANDEPIIACRGLVKHYDGVDEPLTVLDELDLEVPPGARVAIVGTSGSGKSTLMHLLGGLDTATQGRVEIAGQDIMRLSNAARGKLRNQQLGFIYQFHHLLPEFTAAENVAMPLFVRRNRIAPALTEARAVLQQVGLGHRAEHKPSELSGGERQRAAVARALITRPSAIIADEPTGNLDHRTAEQVFETMLELNASMNTSLILATHDRALARRADAVWSLEDGRLVHADVDELN
ncbi:ATP-binding cassette domain-containing protein [Salinisphaera sp. USBA-960]|uniref:ABC transporter ATP-binding protein n=1 Tax=Salinisphaera orenii TaxID=856731 RepID=UPI000DBEA664|nr:ATP-binding cassette domain-containing protein [Salifodinibacter halophilus]NNC25897.1 ATP-binding cassette domain-containing protein [Salifodinibacter halophilus]